MISETEQWQLNGDCNKCRRAEFCRKKCTAKKKADERALRNFANAIIDEVVPAQSIADNIKKWI